MLSGVVEVLKVTKKKGFFTSFLQLLFSSAVLGSLLLFWCFLESLEGLSEAANSGFEYNSVPIGIVVFPESD